MDASLALGVMRSAIGGVVILLGLLLMSGGALGLLRFPDFYTRLHAGNAGDGAGAALLAAGLAIVAEDGGVSLRLALLAVLLVVTAPMLTHLAASAAHAAGLAPLTGQYTAPRPGAKDAQP